MTAAPSTSVVYDVMKQRGLADCVLPPDIRPLAPEHRVLGRAFTIEGREDQALSRDASLLRWAELLSAIPSDHVAVCQPNTRAIALMGELSARALKIKAVRGYVVDGGCRDVDLVEDCGLPVFCTHVTPRDIVARWACQQTGAPIVIGGVTISAGDLVVGDRDGVVVVPGGIADDVIREAARIEDTESEMRRAILSGMDPVAAYRTFGKF